MNKNENTTQNLWNTVKAVLRGRFIATQAYLKKQEKSQINNLTLHLKWLEKEEMKNPRVSRRKEIWGTTSHQSEWLWSKSLQAINAGEGVEKREPSYTVGGNAN